jgi:hypothetical protein
MAETKTPPTAYHTAVTMLAQAILLPAEEQVPWVNRVAALAMPTAEDGGEVFWLKMRGKMHDAVRKTMNIAQQLAELFEQAELQNPASLKQLEMFPQARRRDIPYMGDIPGGEEREDT